MRTVFRRQGRRSSSQKTKSVSFLPLVFALIIAVAGFVPSEPAQAAVVKRYKNKTEIEQPQRQDQNHGSNPSPEELRQRTQEYKRKLAEAKRSGNIDKDGVIGGSNPLDSGSMTVMRFVLSVVSKLDVKEMDTLKIGGVRPTRSGYVRTWTSEHGTIEFDAGSSHLVRFDALTSKFPVPLGIKVGMECDKAWETLGRPDRVEAGNGWFMGTSEPEQGGERKIGYLSFQCRYVQPGAFTVSRISWSQNRPSVTDSSRNQKVGKITTMDGVCYGENCEGTEVGNDDTMRRAGAKRK